MNANEHRRKNAGGHCWRSFQRNEYRTLARNVPEFFQIATSRRRTVSFRTRLLAAALCCSFLATISCGSSKSRPEKWIIPENYKGWLRVDYGIAGAPTLPMDGGDYVVRIPEGNRLQTSSPFNSSIDNNEYYMITPRGLETVELSKWDAARSRNAIEGFAVQNAFGFFTMANGKIQHPGKCVFTGTNAEFRDNDQDCRSWQPGQPEPPKFARHIVLHNRSDQSK